MRALPTAASLPQRWCVRAARHSQATSRGLHVCSVCAHTHTRMHACTLKFTAAMAYALQLRVWSSLCSLGMRHTAHRHMHAFSSLRAPACLVRRLRSAHPVNTRARTAPTFAPQPETPVVSKPTPDAPVTTVPGIDNCKEIDAKLNSGNPLIQLFGMGKVSRHWGGCCCYCGPAAGAAAATAAADAGQCL